MVCRKDRCELYCLTGGCMADDDELPARCRELFERQDEDAAVESDERDCCDCWWRGEDGECLFDGPCPGVEIE